MIDRYKLIMDLKNIPDHPKSQWGEGPWQHEPDFEAFKQGDVQCYIQRVPLTGTFCGYVVVPPSHPLFEKRDYAGLNQLLKVHGGITFLGRFPDNPDDEWLIGFDCSHDTDIMPALSRTGYHAIMFECDAQFAFYKDIDFVRTEVRGLAEQIKLVEEMQSVISSSAIFQKLN